MEIFGILFVLLLLTVFYLFKRDNKTITIKGKGNSTTVKRSISDYEDIRLSSSFDIELVEGDQDKLTLKGEENLLQYIVTKVKKGSLYIKVKKGYKLKPSSSKKGICIKVPVENVSSLSIKGSGNIVCKNTLRAQYFKTLIKGSGNINLDVDVETLFSEIFGSGNLKIKGSAKSFEANTHGSCTISAYNLETENVKTKLSGSGNLQIASRKKIEARIFGSGCINYRGTPEIVDAKTFGRGRILKE